MRCRSTIDQSRSGPGWFGAPSYRNTVAPSAVRADDLPRPHDPAEVGEPEQQIARSDVGLVRDLLGDLDEEPAVDVDGALRRAGRPARVRDEQRVFGIQVGGLEPVRVRREAARPTGGRVAASHGASVRPRRSTTITWRTDRAAATASSAVSFIGTTLPRRGKPSAVISTVASASSSRFATASAPNPENSGSHTAPSFEHAITATTASGVGGRKIPTASSARTPSPARPFASRSEASRSSRYETRRVVPSSPSHAIAVASGVRSAHRSTQLCARFTDPPPNHVAHSTPREVSRIEV